MLAACKTLASKQNISEGYGAKLNQARALLTSLLLTEKPAQFHANTASAEDGSPFLQIPPHADSKEPQKASLQDAKAATLSPHGPPSSTEQEVCVLGSPSPA